MLRNFWPVFQPALRASLAAWVLCGLLYPLVVTGLGHWLTPAQAEGSLERTPQGVVLGSRLIGQAWPGPEWFHGRPSATTAPDPKDPSKTVDAPYNASSSSGSNLGPTSQELAKRLDADRAALDQAQPSLKGAALPADMLTASGSGLDPDISPANAALQAERVADARGVDRERVLALVRRHTAAPSLGLFGEPRVNVLALNLDLERRYPQKDVVIPGRKAP